MAFTIPTTVDKLREGLICMGLDEAVVASMGKTELKARFEKELKKASSEPTTENTSFGIAFEPTEASPEPTSKAAALPKYGSPEWQTYVMSQFQPNELMDGFPRCFGLRRVAQDLLGPIVSSGPKMVSVVPQMTANEINSRAVTVLYEITFDWNLDTCIWFNPNAPPVPNHKTFGAVSDCVEDINTAWGRNPAASADTKAESRALKKALCINVLSAEERVSGYDEKMEEAPKSSKITDQLIGFCEAKAKQLNLNLAEVIKEFRPAYESIKDFTLEDGRELFKHINSFQQN